MAKIEINTSSRFMKRKICEAMRKSYAKCLAELICNSDESYRRLSQTESLTDEVAGSNDMKCIYLFVRRTSDNFEVVDFAEGMTYKTMEKVFGNFGDEKITHSSEGRGLFGQGLLQALLSQEHGGVIRSLVDNKLYAGKIRWQKRNVEGRLEPRMMLDTDTDIEHATKEIRHNVHIPNGNGTNVSFRFKGDSFPQKAKLISRLSNLYLLRLINTAEDRTINVVFLDKNDREESCEPLLFSWPKGEKIGEIDTIMNYENHKISIHGELYRSEEPLSQREAGEDRIGGLLLHDSYRIMDLTLFDFDSNPYASRFFGRVELKGAYDLIREKLNQSEPEEILTDSRDGFVRSHPFSKQLAKVITDWLSPIVDSEKKAIEQSTGWDEETRKRTEKAFSVLNELYREVNQGIKGLGPDEEGEKLPENGLQFDRKNSEIEVNRKYLIGLRVNTEIFPPGTTILVRSTSEEIEISPIEAVVKKPEKEKVVSRVSIRLMGKRIDSTGNLLALIGDSTASMNVKVVKEEKYYPSRPMEFNPSRVHSKPNEWASLVLFVKTNIVPIGSVIKFISSDNEVIIENDLIAIQPSDVKYDDIAIVKSRFKGTGDGIKATVTASAQELSAEAYLVIRSIEPPSGGLFKDFELVNKSYNLLTFFDELRGVIEINLNHPLVKRFFGTDVTEAKARYKSLTHCQILIASIILDELLYLTLSRAYTENKIERHSAYEDQPWLDVKNYVDEKKRSISEAFMNAFMSRSLMEKNAKNSATGEKENQPKFDI